jgi:antitoxin YefM
MNIVNVSEARANLSKLLEQVVGHHAPMTITGKRGNVVVISEEDWGAIQETLYLLSVPGFLESVEQARNEPDEGCVRLEDFEW